MDVRISGLIKQDMQAALPQRAAQPNGSKIKTIMRMVSGA
jgi:hypothetical protein